MGYSCAPRSPPIRPHLRPSLPVGASAWSLPQHNQIRSKREEEKKRGTRPAWAKVSYSRCGISMGRPGEHKSPKPEGPNGKGLTSSGSDEGSGHAASFPSGQTLAACVAILKMEQTAPRRRRRRFRASATVLRVGFSAVQLSSACCSFFFHVRVRCWTRKASRSSFARSLPFTAPLGVACSGRKRQVGGVARARSRPAASVDESVA